MSKNCLIRRAFSPILLALEISVAVSVFAETVTLVAPPGSSTKSSLITLQTNEIAEVLHIRLFATSGSSSYLRVSFGSDFFHDYSHLAFTNAIQSLPVIAGPATLQLFSSISPGTNYAFGICTVKIARNTDLIAPSSSVVIPADNNGPVQIILESSADFITWNPALPGLYGTTTTNRFFRVRAER